MTPERLHELRCPHDGSELLPGGLEIGDTGHVIGGELACRRAGHAFVIREGIPRFRDDSGYASSFGEQWNRYRRTQIDSVNGTTLSADRFYS